MQVTINTNKILLDREMTNYFKKHCEEQLRTMGANFLPPRYDTSHDKINIESINKIKKAYENNNDNILPIINVERFKNTSFYKIKDGRDRVVAAFCNNIPQLNVIIESPYKIDSKKDSKSQSKKNTKKHSKSQSKKNTKKHNKSQSKKTTKKHSKLQIKKIRKKQYK
tara:strand:- start:289 stop:789 length:501 start_codon:yes stop_codon:yes gene_type:complete